MINPYNILSSFKIDWLIHEKRKKKSPRQLKDF